jgi:ABC-type branched-subunit amino acid transport system substrate-binding protein
MQTSFNSRLRHIVIAAVASAACLVIKPIAGISEETIKICAIDDASGDFALPVILKTDGAKLAVAEINAAGGVLGKKLELIHYDGQSDVRRHQEFAQRCILEDRANVVMAGYTSSEREAARAIAVKNKTIFWHNNQGEGGIADKYSFFTGPIPEQQILTGIDYMIKKYGPKMYILPVYMAGRLWVKNSFLSAIHNLHRRSPTCSAPSRISWSSIWSVLINRNSTRKRTLLA